MKNYVNLKRPKIYTIKIDGLPGTQGSLLLPMQQLRRTILAILRWMDRHLITSMMIIGVILLIYIALFWLLQVMDN